MNTSDTTQVKDPWREITPEQVRARLTPEMTAALRGTFDSVSADEGTLWVADAAGEALVPVYNSGPNAAQFVGSFRQPLNAGLISMVHGSEQSFLENDMVVNRQQSKLLDQELGVQTSAMIAVPVHFLGGCRGVLSCVKLRRSGQSAPTSGFSAPQLAAMRAAAQRVAGELQLVIHL